MTNIYEEMDKAEAGEGPARAPNIYEEMDKAAPMRKALEAQSEADLQAQAAEQERFMEQQQFARDLVRLHPELAGPTSMQEERQPAPWGTWSPHLDFTKAPVLPREERSAPKGVAGPSGSGFLAHAKMGLVENPETRRQILADTLFPNDPDGLYRVGFDARGDPIYVGDDGKLHKVSGGLEAFAGLATATLPETIAGTVGGIYGGPGGAALGASSANLLKRQIAGPLLGEPVDPLSRLKTAGIEGVTAGTGELLGRAIAGARNVGRIGIDFPEDEIARAEIVRRQVLADSRGRVNLNLADASDDPFIKAVYQYGWRQPGQPSRILREARTENDLAFQQWTNEVLDQVAAGEPTEISGRRAVNAAQEAMRRAQDRANNIADPYFQAAWQAHPVVRDPTVLSFFNLPGFGEAYDQAVTRARMEGVQVRQFEPPSLQMMDFWLRQLKGRVRALRASPDSAELGGAMQQRVSDLDNALTQAYPELRDARTVYRTARMALVEPLENGKVGALADIPDRDVRQAAAKIFSDEHVSPQHVAQTRQAIESVNPQAWAGVSRQWLASKWDDALQRTQSGEQRNPAGKLQAAVFGTPEEEEVARAMLTPQQFDSFDRLMNAARRLASTPVGGSTTPQELAIGEALEGNIGTIMQVVTSVRHPVKSAEDVARKAAREQNILNLTAAILDPRQRRRIDVITRMRPGKRQAIMMSALISEEATKRFIQSEMDTGPNTKLVAGEEDAIGQ